MKKLILLTTAITRGELHEKSIGEFYKELIEYFDTYEIYHIINIDWPLKLRDKFNIDQTKKLIKEIIPNNVNIIFTEKYSDNPSFGKAYMNVIEALYENNLYNENNYIWWFEDDWKITKNYNFIKLFSLLDNNTNTAISITKNSPLCSLRAGPIMNSYFFKTFFDILKGSRRLDNFNPELKINRNITHNRSMPIYKDFYIICINILDKTNTPYTMNDSCFWHYKRKYNNISKFEKDKKIKFILAFIENEYSKIIYYKLSDNANELNLQHKDDIKNLEMKTIEEFNIFTNTACLNYISIIPDAFQDIGRQFNAIHNISCKK